MSAPSEHLQAAIYSTFVCSCGRCLQPVIARGNHTMLPSWLECINADCEHHGKRWQVPTTVLTRLPEAAQ